MPIANADFPSAKDISVNKSTYNCLTVASIF